MNIFNINRKLLNWCQDKVNKMYEKKGLNDKILDYQIRINQLRHHKNVTDKNIIIENNDGYVQ